MDATAVEYKVLDSAFDETMLGHLCSAAVMHQEGAPARVIQPETSLPETQAAVRTLIGRGLVAIVHAGTLLSERDADAVAAALESWQEPACWQYEVVLTQAGEAALARLDAETAG